MAGPPLEPSIAEIAGDIGRPGGDLRTLVSRSKDTRLLVVFGYGRLVGYDRDFNLVADILKAVDVEEGRRFTLHLRAGHTWSDGAPFTTEDFRYWWEDIATNEEMSPIGPPVTLLVDGERPEVEIIDALTLRYSWTRPNPFFLPALGAASPLFIYMPAHHLKRYHKDYADPQILAELVMEDRARDWVQLHARRDNLYSFDDPDLPTLQPWMMTTRAPAERFVAVRNPNYHRIDTTGQQLPYIDRIILDLVDAKLIPIKTGAGETDLQARGLSFNDYTFLKNSEERNRSRVHLWRTARGAHMALYPNLNASDPTWRALFRDVRFRRALSLAIDRDSVNEFFYFGLGLTGNNSILPESPLFKPVYRDSWANYDIAAANNLLDAIGLDKRSKDGLRLLPDGRPMNLIVETAGEDTEQTDTLQLIRDSWLEIGIRIHIKPTQRDVLRNRVFAGSALMTVWFGLENGIPTANMSPGEFAPTSQQQFHWPKWGQYYETGGEAGEPPDMPAAQRLLDLFNTWRMATDTAERTAIWHEMLAISAEQVFSIGIIGGVMQPVVVKNRLRNAPEKGIFNWEPGAQFGIYRPDTFWIDDTAR